jgi:DNA-binding transcriptional regulator YdaS (Cro superfamily)
MLLFQVVVQQPIVLQPVPFWESPAFTSAIVVLLGILGAYFQGKMAAKVNTTAEKVATIETHTNGMLSALQVRIDTQRAEAIHLAAVAQKDREIAELMKKLEESKPKP